MVTTVTVPSGSNTAPVTLSFATAAAGSLATALLGPLLAAAQAGTLVTYPAAPVSGGIDEFVIAASVSGAVTIPSGFNVVIDAATANVTIAGNGGSNETIFAGSSNFAFAPNGGSGTVVAGYGSDTIATGAQNYTLLGDAIFLGGGTTTLPGGTGPVFPSPTVTTALTVTGGGVINYGSGSGNYFITNAGTVPNSVVVNAGATTVSALDPGGLYVFAAGSLTFVGGGNSTIFGTAGAGPASIFAGNYNSLFVQGADTAGALLVNGGGNSSVLAGAAGGVLGFDGAGGTLSLFGTSSSAFNYLVGGSGAETLNAAFSAGTAVVIGGTGSTLAYLSTTSADAFFGSSGASTILGGGAAALPDLYAFANGASGGSNVIYNWGPNSGLVFLGYGSSGDAAIRAAISNASASSSVASITLPDSTVITLVSLSGNSVNLQSTPIFYS